eukprot:scaffold13190_cov60-Phaeocystis_antarctica.AAC.4
MHAKFPLVGCARGAHPKHAGHGCDAGGVETQQLVERGCRLPSGKQGRGEVRRGQEVGGP